jgi:glycosyltransferase involved in cell wall biosynthesis
MSRLRIAQLAPPWLPVPPHGYGGIEWVVAHLTDGLVERGHDVTLYAPGGSSSPAKLVSPFEAPFGTDHIGQMFPELVHALTCYLEAGRFDIVHDHCAPAGPALGAFSTTPVVVTLHGAFVAEMIRFYGMVGPRLRFVAISESQRAQMPELPYVATIPNGIELKEWEFQPDKEDYLAYLGRFAPDKGAHLAVEVAHALGLPLVLAGKAAEPHEREYLATRVLPALGPLDDYRGEVSDAQKRKIFSRARCMLVPIQWAEPFGLVMAEAMACGTPVVAWRNGAAPEVVDDGRTGYIVDDLDEMIDAVKRIDRIDPAACRRHVEEKFSATAMVDAYERVYERVLDEAG